ncbi:MAG: FAD-dependent monooxygenase [Actinobacteria bacterium]|nr:FAD-dependent monooxygenase [Actinomycetota bacterium]
MSVEAKHSDSERSDPERQDSERYDVAIIGLGPTGATLANLCGLHGLRTIVHERSTLPYSQPRACHIDAEVARVWQQCGFEAELHQLLTVSDGMEYVDRHGRRLFNFEGFVREPLLGWYEDYVFLQPEIESMLRRGLDRYSQVDVRLASNVTDPTALLDDAAFVVACDGGGGGTREQLGSGLVDLGYDEQWLVVDVLLRAEPVPPLPTIIQQVCDPTRLATFVPGHGAHRRWEFRLQGDEQLDVWELLAPWGITPGNGELVRAVPYRFHALVADRWRAGPDGRVLLAGDAAHMMPPFMGQGLCSGVRDAANLAWKLSEVVRGSSAAELLDSYESERRPHAETVVAMSVVAGRTLARLAADETDAPDPMQPDPRRWSRLPGLDLRGRFPIGHQLPQPDRLDERLPDDWVWVASDSSFSSPDGRTVVVAPTATYGERAVLVRPDRYIAATAN